MFVHETQIRVRYGETDQMGVVYYGNYALYYEVGRVEALRSLGMTYKGLEESGVMMPVAEVTAKYIRPAHYDDALTIRTTINKLPTASMHFAYEIRNEAGVVLHQGTTVLVFIDMKTNRPVRCPAELYQKLLPYFESVS
jgi:acyl-CoA thioester hydrolase